MKKISPFLFWFLLIPGFALFGNHIPSSTTEFVPAFRMASLLGFGDFDLHTSLAGDFKTEAPDFYEVQALLYYRLLKHLKVGAFYSLHLGDRHDDDWVQRADSTWEWEDSGGRLESLAGVDLTPRVLLPFLPGRNWLFSQKIRYSYNFYNQEQTLLFRPELSYFLMKNRNPQWNFSAAYGIYFPLNFSDSLIYEQGPYLSLSRYLGDSLILSLFGDYRRRSWSSSRDSLAAGDSYLVTEQSYRLGTSLIWRVALDR